jgi:hypothetical protein
MIPRRSAGTARSRRSPAAAKVPVIYGEESDLKEAVGGLKPDLILSFYYRNMIPMSVLRLAPRGAQPPRLEAAAAAADGRRSTGRSWSARRSRA